MEPSIVFADPGSAQGDFTLPQQGSRTGCACTIWQLILSIGLTQIPMCTASSCQSNMGDKVPDALCEFNDLAFAAEFEVHLIIARRRVIHRFSEFLQGSYNLAGQYEADPYTQQQRKAGHYAQHPFRTIKEMSSFTMILLNACPASGF